MLLGKLRNGVLVFFGVSAVRVHSCKDGMASFGDGSSCQGAEAGGCSRDEIYLGHDEAWCKLLRQANVDYVVKIGVRMESGLSLDYFVSIARTGLTARSLYTFPLSPIYICYCRHGNIYKVTEMHVIAELKLFRIRSLSELITASGNPHCRSLSGWKRTSIWSTPCMAPVPLRYSNILWLFVALH